VKLCETVHMRSHCDGNGIGMGHMWPGPYECKYAVVLLKVRCHKHRISVSVCEFACSGVLLVACVLCA
jgi:hypothetical protein